MSKKPHAVCIPVPAQSHINAMLSVAKLLHQRGFHITFVNTQYNHKRIMRSRGPNSLHGLPDFQFRAIPHGGESSCDDIDPLLDIPLLCNSVSELFLAPFCDLLAHLNDASSQISGAPPISCIVADGCMSFSVQAGAEFNVPVVHLWPISPCSLLGFMHFDELVERGITPFKDESYLVNGHLETTIDWIPGMNKIRLRDLPSFIRTTDPNDILLKFLIQQTETTRKASAIILNTFDALDQEVLAALSRMLPPIYTIGPLHLFERKIKDDSLEAIATNIWEEQTCQCIEWLDLREPNSVIYVNFGTLAVVTPQCLVEFAWGLANSGRPFLWIIRPDLVRGHSAMLPFEFLERTKERGMIASWCAQVEVLRHPSIAGFLTHSGWNSTMESICSGVPMMSWPYFGDQQTTCRYCCIEWGIGLEIESDVKRDGVESSIKELMEGKKGEDMKRRVMELKSKAEESYDSSGSSYRNFQKFVVEILGQ